MRRVRPARRLLKLHEHKNVSASVDIKSHTRELLFFISFALLVQRL